MNDYLDSLRRKWLDSGSFHDEQAYLNESVRVGSCQFVELDPDGNLPLWLGVVVRYETGVIYRSQCAGVATEQRLVEGYYVPLGGFRYEVDNGKINPELLNKVFHEGDGCRFGYCAHELPPDRLKWLNKLVEDIPYWVGHIGAKEERQSLRLDELRSEELAEAWIPVDTPVGAGILVYRNCD